MIGNNKIKPTHVNSVSSLLIESPNDTDSLNALDINDSSYLKLKPFTRLDPTLVRLSTFLNCFGLSVDFDRCDDNDTTKPCYDDKSSKFVYLGINPRGKTAFYLKLLILIGIGVISGEVVYDINFRQSKLLAEQKRSTPLLTFVIVAYSWLSLIIPIISDLSLITTGSYLFRFYSRTTATVCNGKSMLSWRAYVDPYCKN